MSYIYRTKGTCATAIEVELDGDIIKKVRFSGGCNGNLKGISKMVEGMHVSDVTDKLSGISEFIRTAIDKWLMEVSDAERREFIRLVFSAIDASGARKISEFTDHPFNSAASVITALRKADRETQAQASAVLARLAQASSDTFWEAVREKFIPEKEQD